MTHKLVSWREFRTAIALVAFLAVSVSPANAVAQSTSGRTRVPDGAERPMFDGTKIPFPGSVKPTEVVANIRAVAQQTHLLNVLDVNELVNGELRARRVLQVTSDQPPPGFLVAELEDGSGNPIANVAITRSGAVLAVQDARGVPQRRSLNLDEVATRVRARRGRAPLSVEYVYFHNIAEQGISLFRPLVAARTETGVLYFNSSSEAFAEEGSPLVEEQLGSSAPPMRYPPGIKRLRPLGRW